jgi:hypothetical protein
VSAPSFASSHPSEELLAAPGIESLPEGFAVGEIIGHERVPFQSFPFVWPAEMLRSAASLAPDIAEALPGEGVALNE